MNIYHVEFWVTVEVNKKGEIVNGMDNEEEDDEIHSHNIDGEFDLGSMNLANAYIMATEYLDDSVGEDQYEITGVTQRFDVAVVNWPGGDECQCPSCRTERAAEEDKISFKCSCGYEIKIIDDFGEIVCPNCNKTILRDRIIGKANNYILLDIDGGNKK